MGADDDGRLSARSLTPQRRPRKAGECGCSDHRNAMLLRLLWRLDVDRDDQMRHFRALRIPDRLAKAVQYDATIIGPDINR